MVSQLKATFSWNIAESEGREVVVIEDCDIGASVTNDAAAVIAHIAKRLGELGQRAVIYRDTAGVYDGLRHDGKPWTGFYSLGERALPAALAKLARQTDAETS